MPFWDPFPQNNSRGEPSAICGAILLPLIPFEEKLFFLLYAIIYQLSISRNHLFLRPIVIIQFESSHDLMRMFVQCKNSRLTRPKCSICLLLNNNFLKLSVVRFPTPYIMSRDNRSVNRIVIRNIRRRSPIHLIRLFLSLLLCNPRHLHTAFQNLHNRHISRRSLTSLIVTYIMRNPMRIKTTTFITTFCRFRLHLLQVRRRHHASLLNRVLRNLIANLLIANTMNMLTCKRSRCLTRLYPINRIITLMCSVQNCPYRSSRKTFLPSGRRHVMVLRQFPHNILLPIFCRPPRQIVILSKGRPMIRPSTPILVRLRRKRPPRIQICRISSRPMRPKKTRRNISPLIQGTIPSRLSLQTLRNQFPLLCSTSHVPIRGSILVRIVRPHPLYRIRVIHPPSNLRVIHRVLRRRPKYNSSSYSQNIPTQRQRITTCKCFFFSYRFGDILRI